MGKGFGEPDQNLCRKARRAAQSVPQASLLRHNRSDARFLSALPNVATYLPTKFTGTLQLARCLTVTLLHRSFCATQVSNKCTGAKVLQQDPQCAQLPLEKECPNDGTLTTLMVLVPPLQTNGKR